MFYACVRVVVALALRLFYRVKVNAPAEAPSGPVLFVGNHPNGLIDPALVFILTPRKVTFLAKAPLFKLPVIGWLLKGLDALPVYRKQDDPAQMGRNEGTLDAAKGALVKGRAITLFPEGKSHSEPELAELKTGAARIALNAAREGAAVRIVPVGLTYAEKNVFRSEVLIDQGAPIDVTAFLPADAQVATEQESVRALTERVAEGLRAVTLNLEQWEDLPVVRVAEQLYAFRQGGALDAERLRLWARGVRLFRTQEPERYERLRLHLSSFRHRMALVQVTRPEELSVRYRAGNVAPFVVKTLLTLVFGLPLFAAGLLLFGLPYPVPRMAAKSAELDVQATVKFLTALVLSAVWWALLTGAAALWGGWTWGLTTFVLVPPLALFTLYFAERWDGIRHDLGMFFTLGNRQRLRARLLAEGERLAGEVERLAEAYRPQLQSPAPSSVTK
ncbi:acyltransferase [Corallococcus sp. ZKHCc1 1396]|uniref:Acyltransferase n=1 Tax=Corallococcus soli TaxID=2710757 RepID=A0ABR9PPL6_9BACT|nr:lysophospholipid acyltransferase family protein [Corallococcus sp. BB11-1]MBE4749866.1 acyltransferase [Corallococcus soli]MCY1035647.1 lysophospholipid acyltransferase family protein [Corallococcus sp. BB11-1]